MHGKARVIGISGDAPPEVLEAIQRTFSGVPEQTGGEPNEDEGHDDRPLYLVQLVLNRPYKNAYEAHVLDHVLSGIDGVSGPTAALAVLVANPLDVYQANAAGEWTFAVFSLRAANATDAERLVREAVTETVPAPFVVATLRLTEIAKRQRDED